MRFARLLTVPVAAVAVSAALFTPASAYDAGTHTDEFGTVAVAVNPSLDAQLTGKCTYVRSAVGLGSGQVQFTVAAAGTATGLYKGIEITATAVRCDVVKRYETISTGTEWYPGPAAVANASVSTYDATGGVICVQVFARLRHVPVGEPDDIISSPRACH